MKRVDIHYGGEQYSVGGRELDDLQDEIAAGLREPRWLKVNDGEGEMRAAYLLISPGVPIAIIPIPDGPSRHDSGEEAAGVGFAEIV